VAHDVRLEAELRRIGADLAAAFPSRARAPMRALDERSLRIAASDRDLRAALFRLVDVTPACRSLEDLARHLTGYLAEVHEPHPPLHAAMRAAESRAGRAALGAAGAAGVRHMAHRFIAGETPEAAAGELRRLWKAGVATSVDLLGEATVTAEEADRYADRCEAALETLAAIYAEVPEHPSLEADSSGPVPRANLSVKVTALTPTIHPDAPELGREDAGARLRPLLLRAHELGAHLHVDMESLDSLETTLGLVLDLLDEEELREGPSTGVVVQAYLRDSPAELDRILSWAASSRRSPPLVVRLVKGAYWDREIADARSHGWTSPVFESKAECDRNFEALTRRLLDARPSVRVAIGSHNLRSVACALGHDRLTGGDGRDLEVQVLRGLGDDLQHALAAQGHRVRAYCPVGGLVAGMAYLVRRLLENTANESFLAERARGAELEELLAAP
jgi:proline dehydrogenase